jgi:excisionase family DNA binding protein
MIVVTLGRVAPDELLSVAEVAEYMGVTRQTVYRWINARRIEAHSVTEGGTLRVSSAALERFLTSTRRAAVTHNGRS